MRSAPQPQHNSVARARSTTPTTDVCPIIAVAATAVQCKLELNCSHIVAVHVLCSLDRSFLFCLLRSPHHHNTNLSSPRLHLLGSAVRINNCIHIPPHRHAPRFCASALYSNRIREYRQVGWGWGDFIPDRPSVLYILN